MKKRGRKRRDMVGLVFGRLTVTSAEAWPWHECECECGATTSVHRANLQNGDTRSCGCLMKELCKSRPKGAAPLDLDRARELREEGWSHAKIGKEFGVTRQAVWNALTRAARR